MTVVAVVFQLFYAAHASRIQDLTSSGLWSHHKRKYNLQPTPSEEFERRALFFHNLKFIEDHNAKNIDFKLAMNEFGHLRPSELLMKTEMKRVLQLKLENGPVSDTPVNRSVDWRTHGVVTNVNSQGCFCGSCYAFSGIGACESHLAIKTGHLVTLSEQELVNCSKKEGNKGCSGGWPNSVFRYAIHNGLSLARDYKYVGRVRDCKKKGINTRFRFSSYVDIYHHNEEQLVRAVSTKRPVSVVIDANHLHMMFYHSGILRIHNCDKNNLNHAVLVVGYNKAGSKPYYIVKNSWGTWWGEHGYFRMVMNENMCGIASYASYPVP
ncbi:Digestive cysteine proteinase 2 [Thelohanellus kitauei]|uniref:Digestive cysteine proteinase 2 n=1 Tax=Thelohanellus kitauei TaxID=669202 RepID=A0A0C2J416_THEKT|nr:Digestive cysteine proteinase 2 [Thelohanellus kitauei]